MRPVTIKPGHAKRGSVPNTMTTRTTINVKTITNCTTKVTNSSSQMNGDMANSEKGINKLESTAIA